MVSSRNLKYQFRCTPDKRNIFMFVLMRKTTYAKKCITFSIVKSCTIPEVALVLTRGCNFQGPTQIYKSAFNLQFDGRNRPRSGQHRGQT